MTKGYIVCLVLFGLLGCSNGTGIAQKTEAQNKPVLEKTTPTVEPKAESSVKIIGDFSNVKGDGEHEWGYSAALWRQDDKIYGLITGGEELRMIGDPPIGRLEDVLFDPKTKKLSFRATMPMQIVYEFEGALEDKKLTGNMKVTDPFCGDKCPKPKQITLLLSEDMTSRMMEYQSFAEWKASNDGVLKRRGAK